MYDPGHVHNPEILQRWNDSITFAATFVICTSHDSMLIRQSPPVPQKYRQLPHQSISSLSRMLLLRHRSLSRMARKHPLLQT